MPNGDNMYPVGAIVEASLQWQAQSVYNIAYNNPQTALWPQMSYAHVSPLHGNLDREKLLWSFQPSTSAAAGTPNPSVGYRL